MLPRPNQAFQATSNPAPTYDKCEYDVELAGISVQVTKANPLPSDRLAPATAVRVQLPADGIHMLPEA